MVAPMEELPKDRLGHIRARENRLVCPSSAQYVSQAHPRCPWHRTREDLAQEPSQLLDETRTPPSRAESPHWQPWFAVRVRSAVSPPVAFGMQQYLVSLLARAAPPAE